MGQVDGREDAPETSVVILCYREEQYVPQLVASVEAEVQRLGVSYEIVLVANYVAGDDDQTPRITSEMAKGSPRIKVVAQPKEGMMGWDMRSGFEASTGRVLAVIDGDGQFPASDIRRVYRELLARNLDLCQTYRVRREDGWGRVIVSRVYNIIFRLLFPGTGLHDINAKPKVMTRDAYQSFRLSSTDWFIDAEIVIQARRNKLRLGEISSVFGKGRGRQSFVNTATVLEFIKNLIVFRVRETLDRWRGYPGPV